MRFRALGETPIDETERRGRQQSGFTAPDPRPLYVMLESAAIAAPAAASQEEAARWRCRVKLSH
jgi:hypothetical protein